MAWASRLLAKSNHLPCLDCSSIVGGRVNSPRRVWRHRFCVVRAGAGVAGVRIALPSLQGGCAIRAVSHVHCIPLHNAAGEKVQDAVPCGAHSRSLLGAECGAVRRGSRCLATHLSCRRSSAVVKPWVWTQLRRSSSARLRKRQSAQLAGEHEVQVSLGGKSGDGVRAAASEDAGTSPASSQVLFSTVPIVTALCVVMLHVRM